MKRPVEPESPWFVNVIHFYWLGRPWCSSAVDYSRWRWSESWGHVDCAACQRQKAEFDAAD